MHDTAWQSAHAFAKKYLDPESSVLDVGAYDVNGTLRPVFEGLGHQYLGADIEAGPNVDVVLHREWPFADGEFDAVVSSSCLEHDPQFWVTFKEMCRVSLSWVYLNVPSKHGYHAYPVDCWRFLDDSMDALADWAGVKLVETYINPQLPWGDCVGIFDVG